MPAKPLSRAVLQECLDAYDACNGNLVAAARYLGIPRATMEHRLRVAQLKKHDEQPSFESPELPDEDLPIADILDRRHRIWKQRHKAHEARKLIPIKINIPGPIGIAVFGDIHIDNPGSNLPLLIQHTELVRNTEGLFAGAVGDLQDGWVGRLARLWSNQGVTAREARKLVEWWIDQLSGNLIWIVEGNHDVWTWGLGHSPIEWISSRVGAVRDSDGVRLSLNLPNGERFTINCRHDFRGKSMYSPAHGLTKAAMFGWRDDVLLAGHIHESGYSVVKDPMTGRVSHALRVASYKQIDHYAKEQGLPDSNCFECPVIMIDPEAEDQRHRVWIEFDPVRAVRILKLLRAEWTKKNVRR